MSRPYANVPLTDILKWVDGGCDPDANRELVQRVREGTTSCLQIEEELAAAKDFQELLEHNGERLTQAHGRQEDLDVLYGNLFTKEWK